MHLVAVVLAAALGAPQPWEGAPFAAEPRDLYEVAQRLPPAGGAEIDILLEEHELELDEAGRETWTTHLVHVPRTAAAAAEWDSIWSGYRPQFQARPEIRARVVGPGGESRWLDPATLTDGVVGGGGRQSYSDMRAVQGPLPAVQAGVVVEEWYRTRGTEPFFAAGVAARIHAGRPVPVRRLRMRVEAPEGLPLRHRVHGLPAPVVSREGNRQRLLLDVADLPAAPPVEPLAPLDRSVPRHLALSTGRSWREVAAAYAALVERQLAGADLAATARQVIGSGKVAAAEAARRVLEWIGARTRYTALSLGEAGLVPARPAETLARGYGDCKDLSLLAVGLLRAAGFRASVVILRTAADDVDPDLPGLGTFDHAVARVEAAEPVWLDPAAGSEAGQLGAWAQGRLALVIEPGSDRLVRTAESGPEGSQFTRAVRIELSELEQARVTEETWYGGAVAAEYAQAVAATAAADWEKRVRERLAAEPGSAVEAARTAPPRPGPHQRNVAQSSRWGYTGDDEAEAVVGPSAAFRRLPPTYRIEALGAGERDEPPPARALPMRLAEPHRTEVTYRVVPPPGFQLASLPQVEGFQVGPARFEASAAKEGDGTVVVRYRFEVGRHLAPAEVDRLWREVASRTREDGPRVRYERTSRALLLAGKAREGLDEIRRMARLHPGEALHRHHLASALLSLRMGEAARAAAEEAVRLEPQREWPHRLLGWVHLHDLLGRPFRPGADLVRAEAELRRALELDPRSFRARGVLAQLLVRGSDGRRFGKDARLAEALAELRTVRHELKQRDFDEDLLALLLRLRRDEEALALAREMAPGPARNAALVAAAYRSGGLPAMQRELAGLAESGRLAAAQGAVVELMNARDYPAVSALAREGLERGGGDQAAGRRSLAALERARPIEEVVVDRADPAMLPHRLAVAMTSPEPVRDLQRLVVGAREGSSLAGDLESFTRALTGMPGLEARVAGDLAVASMQVSVEGKDSPWRVTMRMPTPQGKDASVTLYAITRDGEARLVDPEGGGLALEALRLARSGELAGARRLLGWARDDIGPRRAGPEQPGGLLAALWTGGDGAGAEELSLAAAAVVASGPAAAEAIPILEQRRAGLTGGARRAAAVALLQALERQGASDRVESLAAEIRREHPDLVELCASARYWAALRAGRAALARDLARTALDAVPGDTVARRRLAMALHEAGDVEGAARAWSAVIGSDPGELDWNEAAWQGLYREPPAPVALEWARTAVEKRPGSAGVLHTLAAAQAWSERPGEAMATLFRAIDARGGELRPEDWVVVGRVAESYGLPGEARTAYRRIEKPAVVPGQSTWELARRRLEALDRRP